MNRIGQLRRELKHAQVEAFFRQHDATEAVLEARGGSHHWGRLLGRLGHRVRLIPPQYDAEAISEAASRPSTSSVAVKTADQQADAIVLRHREMLVSQRT
jgi:transposase